MADEMHHPHDMMVHTVLRDVPEAASFLQAYLAEDVRQRLNWSTLTLREGMEWAAIERVTGVNAAQFQALKQQVEDMNE